MGFFFGTRAKPQRTRLRCDSEPYVGSLESFSNMGKHRKLTAAEKRARKQRRKEFMTIFVHGKQKRVRRPVTIDGMDVDEFIRRNADPIWLHQNELWEYMDGNEAF
jgi:hypothetical protein